MPKLLRGQVVQQHSEYEQHQDPCQHGAQDVDVAKRMDLCRTEDRNEGRGPGWRVQRSGDEHDGRGTRYGQTCCHSEMSGEELECSDTAHGGDDLASYQAPRLSEGCVGSSK